MALRFSVGQTFRTVLLVHESLVRQFAELSGDRNPIHLDPRSALAYGHPRMVAHGGLLLAAVSRLIGMEIPGEGAIWVRQVVEWPYPAFVGDRVEVTASVTRVSDAAGVLDLKIHAENQDGKVVMTGEARVKVGTKISAISGAQKQATPVVLVTGGSRGIGAAIARRVARAGMAVAINYHVAQDQAEGVVDEIRSAGGQATAFRADLRDPEAASALVREVLEKFGQIDIVVHAASPALPRTSVQQLRYAEVEQYLRLYAEAAISIVAGALPGMIERKFGRFIFLGTGAMLGTPTIGWAAYLIAKHALWGLVRSMAMELGPLGITANMVSPGMTVTELTADIPLRAKEIEARRNPMRRLATPDDTAEVVVFLASAEAGYISGVNLPVVGGPA